jgi:hypothetical protein
MQAMEDLNQKMYLYEETKNTLVKLTPMKNKIQILILALTLSYNVTFAQLIHEFDHIPFDTCLSISDSTELIAHLSTEHDSAIICFNLKKEKTPFNFSDKWKLVYYVHTGWEEDYTGNHEDINDIYKCTCQANWLTGSEIFSAFDISDTLIKDGNPSFEEGRFSVNWYLQIPDAIRGYWIPIISKNNYLIISQYHLYPNGNAHSWLRQYTYYFQKMQ